MITGISIRYDESFIHYKIKGKMFIQMQAAMKDAVLLHEADIHRFIDAILAAEMVDRHNGLDSKVEKLSRDWCDRPEHLKVLMCFVEHFGVSSLKPILSKSTRYFLNEGSEGGWNNHLFKAAKDMQQQGMDFEQIKSMMNTSTNPEYKGQLDESDLVTIKSALKTPPSRKPRLSGKCWSILERAKEIRLSATKKRVKDNLQMAKGLSTEEKAKVEDIASKLDPTNKKYAKWILDKEDHLHTIALVMSKKFDLNEIMGVDTLS